MKFDKHTRKAVYSALKDLGVDFSIKKDIIRINDFSFKFCGFENLKKIFFGLGVKFNYNYSYKTGVIDATVFAPDGISGDIVKGVCAECGCSLYHLAKNVKSRTNKKVCSKECKENRKIRQIKDSARHRKKRAMMAKVS